jgi:hypothetical protein
MADQETPQETSGAIAARIAEAGKRAKAEADARREKAKEEQSKQQVPPELGGPKGPEPTRYGDWERKGIAVDF